VGRDENCARRKIERLAVDIVSFFHRPDIIDEPVHRQHELVCNHEPDKDDGDDEEETQVDF
jgi:hypothetical protein